MKKNRHFFFMWIMLGIIVLLIGVGLFLNPQFLKEDEVTVGFIMPGTADESGYNGLHYKGLKTACGELDVPLVVKENVGEFTGECEKAIDELYKNGVRIIILGSYNYPSEVENTIKRYGDCVFYGSDTGFENKNYTAYSARLYQGRYLAGIIAGLKSKNNEIGYVAAMNNNEVIRGINAFTLGVRSVNPSAHVNVIWTGSWDDEGAEIAAVDTLYNKKKVDVITYHQNQTNAQKRADDLGIYSIGFHVSRRESSEKALATVTCDWSVVYRELVSDYLKGTKRNKYWFGIDDNAVKLIDFSTEVDKKSMDAVNKAKVRIIHERDVFTNQIYDTKGRLRCGIGESISDENLLLHMDWFVDGVEIYE